ncbi:ankyrin repeat and KH domain-containing protein mask-like isoform X1 [Anopheles aquasalis]|uniref:ankyrin repeat and KH domain-containing protein mask-like isoform X1 n=1 Tax=Anopheles aquasalis TaxID=42839 RepID=UPI00215AD03D|nr:ankyrin repeat and KH domain-containing protein mask-like isoform X1 [Anopheles aquasalis]
MSQATTGSGHKMGKISGSHCLVLGCRNRQLLNQTNTRSYFRFPRDADLCKKWVDFCNRPELYKKYDENGPEYLYKSSRICSDHFQPNDFNNPNLYSQGLKKGSTPTVNPASKEPKSASSPLNGVTTATGNGASGCGGGSGSSNGTGSPIDEKLLTAAVASMAASGTQLPADHLSLFYAAAIAAAAQAQAASNHHSVPLNLKRTAPPTASAAAAAAATNNNSNSVQSSGVTSATSATTTTTSTTPPAATGGGGGGGGPVSAKRNRAVPPLATPTGALANLIQRQQQIKEQQRKAAAAAAAALASANQVSITPTSGGTGGGTGGGVTTPAARAPHSLVPINTTTTTASSNGGGAPPPSKRPTLNNNNNNVSNNNHNHHSHSQNQKPSLLGKRKSREDGNGSGSDYGINMMDIDMLSGAESSEGDSSNGPASADEEYAAYRRQLKKVTRKVEEVIPLALKSQLTVTPANLAGNVSSTTTTTTASTSPTSRTATTINNNSIHNVNANGGGGGSSPVGNDGGLVDYKQKYELTLKELFACRKIVKNQNKAMKQLQGEIDFLNLLLKEK